MAARDFFAELPEKAEPDRLAGVDSSYLFDVAGEGRWLVEVRDQKVTVTENPEGERRCRVLALRRDLRPPARAAAEPDDRLHDREAQDQR